MDREIKFRALRTEKDGIGWAVGSLILPNAKTDKCYIIGWNGAKFEVIPESVGQYTGLKDKNGVEIYEGDIVQFSTRRYHLGMDKGLQTITFKSPVVFEDGCFLISEKNGQDTYLYAHENQIVIGNIHQP